MPEHYVPPKKLGHGVKPPAKPEDSARAGRSAPQLTRYDQALRAAKNANHLVKFSMAMDTDFTDGDGSISGYICEVDKFSIQIKIGTGERRVWLSKPMIVGTEVIL